MDYLAQSEAAVPLLVLASARPEVTELSGSGAGFVAAATQLALGPLSGEETGRAGSSPASAPSRCPPKLQALILEALRRQPALRRGARAPAAGPRPAGSAAAARSQLKPGVEMPLPDSIGALIAARLDLLSAERQGVARRRRRGGQDLLGRGCRGRGRAGRRPGSTRASSSWSPRSSCVPSAPPSIEGESEFTFVHALVCDVAYSQLTRADRAIKHARLAQMARGAHRRDAPRTSPRSWPSTTAPPWRWLPPPASSSSRMSWPSPPARYLELAGGRAAPLDATAAAAHFARAERVADEAAQTEAPLLPQSP